MQKPLGNFEIAPELIPFCEKRPLDLVYEHFVGREESEEGGLINVRAQLLRGVTQPHSQVACWSVDAFCSQSIELTFSPQKARTLGQLLIRAAADAEAAFEAAVKKGGVQ